MIIYKLTDKNGVTRAGCHNALQWYPGVAHKAMGPSPELCTDGLIHGYEDALLGVMMDPIHGEYLATPGARMFQLRVDGRGLKRDGQLKCGARVATCIREIPVPVVTNEQRIKFAIYCAAAAQGIQL